MALGGFVAGLDAGMGYNTWPLMDGQWVPKGLLIMEPAWCNFFENAMTVQFDHRMVAYAVTIYAAVYAFWMRSRAAKALLHAVVLQVVLGIWTLSTQVPLWLGLAHQAGAMIVFATAVWAVHEALSAGRERAGIQSRDRLIEIGDDVVDILDADRQAHHVGTGARLLQLLGRELAVGRRRRMDDERARVAEIGEMREKPGASTPPSRRRHSRP